MLDALTDGGIRRAVAEGSVCGGQPKGRTAADMTARSVLDVEGAAQRERAAISPHISRRLTINKLPMF